MTPRRLVVATSNLHKLDEFRRLLPATFNVVGLDGFGVTLPPETGASFIENARIKALSAARQTGEVVLADDSGLEVDALGGAPGIRSARFAGEPPSDERNRAALLAALAAVPEARRGARFVCALVVAVGSEVLVEAEGICPGRVARVASGIHGFGYDPLFELADGRTLAQLLPADKDAVSHRAHACRAILPRLLAIAPGKTAEETVR